MELAFSILPALLFLAFLFLLDSFKLVLKKYLVFSVCWGAISAGIAYITNNFVLDILPLPFDIFSRYVAPGIEELIKSLFLFFVIFRKRAGFLIDAAIYGFAIGTGFALVENILYLQNNDSPNLLIWVIRGFGTALMHGGCTALLSVILIGAKNRNGSFFANTAIAMAAAYIIHSAFNHFYIDPLFQTLGIIIVLPLIFILIFRRNEIQLQNWLEIEFSSEIELINMINKGQFLSTRAGQYLASLKSRFSGEVILDMYCYIRLYLELSIKAKRNLMLRENGFPAIQEQDIEEKLTELRELRKHIGKVGEITLSPLIRMNYRDLWKLNLLK
ncbi:MAG: PrsW family glutamic-type intramembrane protease [Prolixibacteraceae bacterium]|nr:PrsW family glutamic-type intramembrane protease [Prolixibacteraceae bacterium]